MIIQFISHAGFVIQAGETTLLVDPWFRGSDLKHPVIESFTGHRSIDFQYPRSNLKFESLPKIDGIFTSHFHAHHAPLSDILEVMKTNARMVFGYPDGKNVEANARQKLLSLPSIHHLPSKHRTQIKIGDIEVTGFEHTVSQHLAWFFKSSNGSFLHIADERFNKDVRYNTPDAIWAEYADLKPDYVAISAGGSSTRMRTAQGPQIVEFGMCTPIQAARLVQHFGAKAASVMGCYNFSCYKNESEYFLPSHVIEEQFEWAIEWLSPSAKNPLLRPGLTIGLGAQADFNIMAPAQGIPAVRPA